MSKVHKGRGVVAIVLSVAVGVVSLLGAAAASASVRPNVTGTFTMAPIVGVRASSATDGCSVGPVSGTNCPTTIVLTGTNLPTLDPSLVGLSELGTSTNVAVV